LHEICLREIRYAARQGGSETDMERAANRIVSKLLARPMTVLRDTDRDQDVEVVHGAMRLIFENERMQELAASQDLATRQDLAPQTNLEAASG
jgi:glutamyl-tRNA reductase